MEPSGNMAKATRTEELMLEAIQRAIADPAPRPLHGTRASPGMFLSSSAAAKIAAQQCLDQGLLDAAGEHSRGRRTVATYRVSRAGLDWALHQSPTPRLLAAMLDAIECTRRGVAECARTLESLGNRTGDLEQIIRQVAKRVDPVTDAATVSSANTGNGNMALGDELARLVRAHKSAAPLQSIELPELFRLAARKHGSLTIGKFHDAIRTLLDRRQIRLRPYTQAMYKLAEPEYALIVGREVMYYADVT